MHRLRAVAAPLVLLLTVTGFFWKLLTKQYTWLDQPDMAYQVMPWLQFQAASWHRGEAPLWDPHEWGGQPLVGQLQPGAAYPLNWPLFLLPLKDGHIQPAALNLYFVFAHFLAALFCFWLCRDLGLSGAASIVGGLAFALGGFAGNVGWLQVLNGVIWIPLVALFCLRSIRGQRPTASAALAGTFLGFSFLSGHHQIPVLTALMACGLWIYEIARNRTRAWKPVAAFFAFAILTGALQILPAYEYGTHAIRFAGLPYGIYWNQSVPYTVHAEASLPPLDVLGVVLGHFSAYDTFMGLTAVTLALIGFSTNFGAREIRLLSAIVLGGLLFAFGAFSVFHGAAYLFIPAVEKASFPQMALVIAQFGIAVLAAYGVDAIRGGTRLGRWWIPVLALAGALPWPVLAIANTFRVETGREYERLAIFGLAALSLAAILKGLKSQRLGSSAATVLLAGLMLFELGTVTGGNYRHRDHPGGFLAELSKNRDAVDFLRAQPDFERLELDVKSVPANLGDWNGIDAMQAYLGGLTSNVAQIESVPVAESRIPAQLFSLTHYLGPKPIRDHQREIFRAASGLAVYRNEGAFPRAWTVHDVVSLRGIDLLPRLERADLRRQAFVAGAPPALDRCGGADQVRILERAASGLVLEASMACKGMVVVSETFFPGWQASVDSRRGPIFEVDGALRGVAVEAGMHRIEMRYRPYSVYAGGIMTLAGFAAAAAVALAGLRRDQKALRDSSKAYHEKFA